METNTDIGCCSSNIVNDVSNKIVDVKVSYVGNAVENADKFRKCIKDSDDIKLDITAEELTKDEEPWEIKEDSNDSIVCDLEGLPFCGISSSKLSEAERKVLVPNRRLKNLSGTVFKPFSNDLVNDNKIKELETEDESNLQAAKKIKPLCFTEFLEMHMNLAASGLFQEDLETNQKIPKKKNDHNVDNKMILNQSINNDKYSHKFPDAQYYPSTYVPDKWNFIYSHFDDKYEPSCSENIYGPSCSKEFNGPSCSKDVYGPSNSTSPSAKFSFLDSVSKSPKSVDLERNSKKKQEEEAELLLSFYNKSHLNLNDFSLPTANLKEKKETNKSVKVSGIGECNLVKDLLNNINLNNSNEDFQSSNSSESSECFEEDPDIVNPDIMYNIDLNEHYKQMEFLVEKITKTPNDLLLLSECLQLSPIPQIESSKKTFTAEERQNFAEGISNFEYEIDKDDWNKIMVKRAVVFTLHAGFSIANEESLYVLADVTINNIKKLAVIMKKNFDIQSKSSCSDSIDPINNSLQEIGVKGGISELIKHYDNDVFGKRNKLLKKCHHLQKIINQFVEHKLADPKIKNKYTKDSLGEENLSYTKILKMDENVLLSEKRTATDSIKTVIQSMAEEVKIDNTEETTFTNTEVEQPTDPVDIDSTDNECKIDTDSNNFEKIKTDFIDLTNDNKIGSNKINLDRKFTDYSDIDLLKPLGITPAKSKCQMSKIKEGCSSSIEKSKNCYENVWDMFVKRSYEPTLSQKLVMDQATEQIKRPPNYAEAVIKEFHDEFELFKARSHTKRVVSSINLASTQSIDNVANDNLPLIQQVDYRNTDQEDENPTIIKS